MVGRNAVEPGAELTVTLKSAEPGDGFDEDFLGNFLGILRMKNHPQSDVVDPRLVSRDELLERIAITGLCARDDIGVVVGLPRVRQRVWQHTVPLSLDTHPRQL